MSTNSLQERLDNAPMSRYQWLIVGLCLLLNAQDGFDISAVAYASTGITDEWGLTGTELGTVISVGLLGIVVGSFLLAPLADRLGRKNAVIIALVLDAIGMAVSAIAQSPAELIVGRLITGMGVGGVIACLNVIASEYSSPRLRGMSVGIFTAGYGIGATVGGIGAATLLGSYGWRSIFVVGTVITVVVLVLVIVVLPESIGYLVTRRPRNALQRLNRIAVRLGQPALAELPQRPTEQRTPGLLHQVAALFAPHLRTRTLLLWAGFFCSQFAFYFLSGWTPRLTVVAGHSQEQSALVGLLLSLGGSTGALIFGIISVRLGAERLVIGYGMLGALAFVGLGLALQAAPLGGVIGVAIAAGLLCNGLIVGWFTLAPSLYPPSARATGVGWANGVGRIGSILSPLAVGMLLDAGWPLVALYAFAGVFLVLVGVVAFAYRRAHAAADAAVIPPVAVAEDRAAPTG
ncbi:MFS transporter [Enemella evansiae]|uniref:MFS transporter n=1 Tax=Enemella evansiae TaxID=2016499 RepID=UPI000B96CA9C|nr:MFS transporter [Enemella evansiae]OYO16064.1 MFS transporter [Enemella evansiae]